MAMVGGDDNSLLADRRPSRYFRLLLLLLLFLSFIPSFYYRAAWNADWTDLFFRFVTNHTFDRQTDGRTDRIIIARPRLHSMKKNCV